MTEGVKDNLKDYLAKYSEKDIRKIREEKMQLVTAELEKKLATAVEALKRITEIPDQEEYFDCEECISMMEEAAEQALAEIGGTNENNKN